MERGTYCVERNRQRAGTGRERSGAEAPREPGSPSGIRRFGTPVITSYSIHYTKLYDESVGNRIHTNLGLYHISRVEDPADFLLRQDLLLPEDGADLV